MRRLGISEAAVRNWPVQHGRKTAAANLRATWSPEILTLAKLQSTFPPSIRAYFNCNFISPLTQCNRPCTAGGAKGHGKKQDARSLSLSLELRPPPTMARENLAEAATKMTLTMMNVKRKRMHLRKRHVQPLFLAASRSLFYYILFSQ